MEAAALDLPTGILPHQDISDVRDFLGLVSKSPLFRADSPIIVTRAPGRLDVMGGISDYSGSLVLQLPIREAALVALQRVEEPILRIESRSCEKNCRSAEVSIAIGDLPGSYEKARSAFSEDPRTAWAAYVAGVFTVLMLEKGIRLSGGIRILIASDVPEGKGVSSSAAIEVAVMQAAVSAYGIAVEARELALLCQLVENRVVGAPCGVMDQMASAAGKANHLLALVCQPAEVQGNVEIPEDVGFLGIDSGVRHSVSGGDYGSVRVGAFMGFRILADVTGREVEMSGDVAQIRDDPLRGWLANVSPSEFEQYYALHIPQRMMGAEFLARYGGITDSIAKVDPSRDYAVRTPMAHPIYENHRTRTFAALLRHHANEHTDSYLELLGELMYQSHASYSACGLGSFATDELVNRLSAAGPNHGIYGAKITGGGSGGTVAVLLRRGYEDAVVRVAEQYGRANNRSPYIFSSSSQGAADFGSFQI